MCPYYTLSSFRQLEFWHYGIVYFDAMHLSVQSSSSYWMYSDQNVLKMSLKQNYRKWHWFHCQLIMNDSRWTLQQMNTSTTSIFLILSWTTRTETYNRYHWQTHTGLVLSLIRPTSPSGIQDQYTTSLECDGIHTGLYRICIHSPPTVTSCLFLCDFITVHLWSPPGSYAYDAGLGKVHCITWLDERGSTLNNTHVLSMKNATLSLRSSLYS